MTISVEESNRRQYERDLEKHDCGYWSVCDDCACGCAISDKVNGFDNGVYQSMKDDLQRIIDGEYDYYDAMDDYEDDDNEPDYEYEDEEGR